MINVCVYWVVASRGSGELGPICNLSDLTPIHQVDLPLRDLRDNALLLKATADVMTGAVAYCFP